MAAVLPLAAIVLALLIGCRRPVDWAGADLYVWQTRPDLAPGGAVLASGWPADRLLVRVGDADWREGSVLEGVVDPRAPLGADHPWMPVVFLTTAFLDHLDPGDANRAEWLYRRVAELAPRISAGRWHTLQVDADWNASNRDAYFALLRALSAQCRPDGVEVTATVRLHQIRDRAAMGVPPVARATLMLYGTGDPARFDLPWNGIMDSRLLDAYLDPWLADYPVDLDFAFPLYTQIRCYSPWKKLYALARCPVPVALPADLVDRGGFREATTAFNAGGVAIMPGDLVKVDVVAPATVRHARGLIARLYRRTAPRLQFFDAEPLTLRSDTAHEIRALLFD